MCSVFITGSSRFWLVSARPGEVVSLLDEGSGYAGKELLFPVGQSGAAGRVISEGVGVGQELAGLFAAFL